MPQLYWCSKWRSTSWLLIFTPRAPKHLQCTCKNLGHKRSFHPVLQLRSLLLISLQSLTSLADHPTTRGWPQRWPTAVGWSRKHREHFAHFKEVFKASPKAPRVDWTLGHVNAIKPFLSKLRFFFTRLLAPLLSWWTRQRCEEAAISAPALLAFFANSTLSHFGWAVKRCFSRVKSKAFREPFALPPLGMPKQQGGHFQ